MSNSGRNMNTPERNKLSLGSGLFNDYESRLGFRRLSLKSNTSLSERLSPRSPIRNNYKFDKLPGDENLISKRSSTCPEKEMTNPLRSGLSPFRTTPFSYSKRTNINNTQLDDRQNGAGSLNNSRVGLLMEQNSPSKHSYSPNSSLRSINCEEKCPSTFAGRMITVANQMDCDQFPWVAYNGSIPMILSSPHRSTSPLAKVNSPSGDVNGSFRNRVRVRLSKPIISSASALNSDVDNATNLDGSSTTKSVIQVLKEIARKRCMATDEEEEHEGLPQAKRRTQHNLYLSRLEREEEELVPAPQTRMNAEDERTKRTRDPDWDTPNVSKPKRPRKNYNFVNNEIISSLSSSIGLHALKYNGRKRSSKKSIAIQVQTLVPEEIDEEKKEKVLRSRTSQHQSSPPKTRDTGVLTDPIPEPRPRSPVKEKVVSDVNGILKSALTKFDIQPSASTAGADNITDSPSNSLVPAIPVTQSTIAITGSPSTSLVTQFSSSNQIVTSSTTSVETTASSSFSLATSKSSFTPITSAGVFMAPVSTPQITFGTPSVLSEKPTESTQPIEKEEGKLELLSKGNQVQLGFKLESKQALKSESPFKFGVPLSDSNVKPSVSQPQTVTSALFNFKVPETSAHVQAPAISSPVFSFGTPKVPAGEVKATEEQKNIFGGTLTTPVPALSAPVTSVLQPSKTESSPLAVTGNNNSDPRKESSKSTSGFSFQSKLTEPVASSKEEKKEVLPSEIFTFGKPESNTLTEPKPFQFGSGGFSFGQANKANSAEPSIIPGSQSISSASSTTTTQAGFSFSSGVAKKDEKPGGFTFNAPVKTINDPKSLFTFNATTAASVAPAPPSFVSTTTVASAKPFSTTTVASAKPFSNSLFGNSSENSNVLTSTVTNTTNSLASNSNIPAATFGTVSKPAPTFGLNSTTSTAPTFGLSSKTSTAPAFGLNNTTPAAPTFGSTESPKLIFGGGSNPPAFGSSLNNAPVFGSNAKKETNKPPAFGSSTTRSSLNPPAFGIGVPSTSSNVPTFGSVAAGSNNPPAFGSSAVVSSNQTGFGTTATATSASKNSTFGGSTTNANFSSALSGGTGSTAFGNTTVSGATPPQPFGPSSAATSTSAFGGSGTNNATSFGNTPAFGSSSSVPTFGTSTSTNFGNSALPTPAFGNQPQQGFGSQAGTSFGSTPAFGQSSTTPAFGSPSTFGNPGTSTQAFGSTPTFGNSGGTFGSASLPAATPAFGAATASTFGSSSGFGSQETNKPFTFNAPASQPAQSGTFNFTSPAPQPQQASGGLFQFGAGATSTSTNQPFQFNASQSSASGFTAGFSPGVGGTGQQMFSIGSGSTAPRRVTGRRKK